MVDDNTKASAEKTKKPMTQKEIAQLLNDRGEEYVDFMLPFNGADTKPVMIGVNGEFIRVRPGVTVSVKRKFVEAWLNAQTQERAAWEAQIKAQNAGRKALAEL